MSFSTRKEYLDFVQRYNATVLGELNACGRFWKIEYARGPKQGTGEYEFTTMTESHELQGKGAPEGVMFAFEDVDGALRFGWSALNKDGVNKLILHDDFTYEYEWIPKERNPFCCKEGLYRAIKRSKLDYVDKKKGGVVPKWLGNRYRHFIQRTLNEFDRVRDHRRAQSELHPEE